MFGRTITFIQNKSTAHQKVDVRGYIVPLCSHLYRAESDSDLIGSNILAN